MRSWWREIEGYPEVGGTRTPSSTLSNVRLRMLDDTILVTGGAGFIGSAMIRHLIRETRAKVINLDALTYAANLANLKEIESDPRYRFEQVDICSADDVQSAFERHRPTALLHFAAESHVDRSIDDPLLFVRTNVLGHCDPAAGRDAYWRELSSLERARFRFHHVSTDEVFGSLGPTGNVHRSVTLPAQLTLRGEQGRGRSSGACLAQDLWVADGDQQLLEQLSGHISSLRSSSRCSSSRRATVSRCRSTVAAKTSATGCSSKTTPVR